MTFPGESLPVWDVGNTAGTPILDPDSITLRAGVSTFASGDEAWVDVDLFPLLLAPGDDAVVSWVVEVLAGSGTLDLSEDAGSLGSHTVTAGTLVVASSLTAADVLAGGMARLTIACTAGSVDVQQVKLRVWPPGGEVGGWSAPFQPDAVPIGFDLRFSASTYTTPAYIPSDTADHAMTATQMELRAEAGGTQIGDAPLVADFSDGGMGAARFYALAEEFTGADPPARGSGTIAASVGYLQHRERFVPAPPGTYGTDWVYPPNEVPDDPDGWDVIGDDDWGWYQGVATIRIDPDPGGNVEGVFRVGAAHVADVDSPTETFEVICDGGEISGIPANDIAGYREFDLSTDVSTQMQADGYIRITVWHDGLHGDVSDARTTVIPGVSIEKTTGFASANVFAGYYTDETLHPLLAAYTAGAYRYWTLTAARVIPLRQYHRDDGLGVAPPRAFGGASRIRTGRAYGYD